MGENVCDSYNNMSIGKEVTEVREKERGGGERERVRERERKRERVNTRIFTSCQPRKTEREREERPSLRLA